MFQSTSKIPGRLSRAEIETLCILDTVGREGCPPEALARKLGLSDSLGPVLVEAVDSLRLAGLLVVDDEEGRARCTTLGMEWLAAVR